ncbi:MAG: hypothetical protein CMJ90_14180 [Planctomycetes bacterium]|nr:hypothetical protein [Planctomycetota bacterium]
MRVALVFVFFGLSSHLGCGSPSNAPAPALAATERKSDALASVEGTALVFVKNRGQVPAHYRLHSVGFGQTALFADSHVVLSRSSGTSFVVSWDGARETTAEPGVPSNSRHSFLYGKEEADWHQNVTGRSSVIYPNKYDGIDLHFTGENGNLKSTYYVTPGMDPLQIRWRYTSSCLLETSITERGELTVVDREGGAVVTEAAPLAWQTVSDVRRPVPVRYALFGDGSVGFELGAYDPATELVIDPDIEWATFLGGSGTDHINDIDVDSEGMVYLTGYAHSKYCDETFPVLAADRTTPLQWWYGGEIGDAFVVKIDPDGKPAPAPCPQVSGSVPRLIYSTRLGGGRTYVCNTGLTCASTVNNGTNCCPTWMTDPLIWNANCTPADLATALRYGSLGPGIPSYQWHLSTLPASFYPYPTPHPSLTCSPGQPAATRPHGSDHGFGIAVDSNGEVVVVGRTESDDFPGTGSPLSPNPALVSALNPSWQPALGSNFVGQCGPSPLEAFSDAFIARLNANGTQLVFSTYFGGVEHEQALAVDLDSGGNAYVIGYVEAAPSSSITPPNWLGCPTSTGDGDGFLLKFDPMGTFVAGRYLGGTAWDTAIDLDVGPNPDDPTQERVFITGTTRSPDFVPITCVDATCAPIPLCLPGGWPGGTQSLIQGTYAGHFNDEHDFFYDTRMTNKYGDGWIARYSLDLVTCENFTYFDACTLGAPFCSFGGGASDEWVEAIAVDDTGTAWIAAVLGIGQPPWVSNCGTYFQRSIGVLAGVRLSCNQPPFVQAASAILGEDVVHPFDIAVDQHLVYVTGTVARLKVGSAATGLTTRHSLSGNWLYDHRSCNGNMTPRNFDLSQMQQDGTCLYNCATFDGFVGAYAKSPTMPSLFLSYLGGEGVELLHAIAPVGGGFVVGGAAGKPCAMPPRKNWLCEPFLFNRNEIDVPGAPGHCLSGGYGPLGSPDLFNNVYQGSRYSEPGSAEAYLVYIKP